MSGSVAKKLRKMVYKDESKRNEYRYNTVNRQGTIEMFDKDKRKQYKEAKKAYKRIKRL